MTSILSKLDPHSVYLARNEQKNESEIMRGDFVGIGVNFYMHKDSVAVIKPIENGPAAKAATTEARRLSTVLSVPVEMFDERLTTVAADRVLKEAELSATARRQFVDKVAAAIMLQAWLERRRNS